MEGVCFLNSLVLLLAFWIWRCLIFWYCAAQVSPGPIVGSSVCFLVAWCKWQLLHTYCMLKFAHREPSKWLMCWIGDDGVFELIFGWQGLYLTCMSLMLVRTLIFFLEHLFAGIDVVILILRSEVVCATFFSVVSVCKGSLSTVRCWGREKNSVCPETGRVQKFAVV